MKKHCVKKVEIRSFSCSVFSRIWTEYGDLLRKYGPEKTPYLDTFGVVKLCNNSLRLLAVRYCFAKVSILDICEVPGVNSEMSKLYIFFRYIFIFASNLLVIDNYFFLITDRWTLRKKCPYPELFWSTFSPHFSAFGLNTERYLSVFSPNAVICGKNADQDNSEYGHFLRSDT